MDRSEQWHLGGTGGSSSCLKISILLHRKISFPSLEGYLGLGVGSNTTSGSPLQTLGGSSWFQGRGGCAADLWNPAEVGDGMAEHRWALGGVNGCRWRRVLCYRLKPGPDIALLHRVLLIWGSLLYSNGIALDWHQEGKLIPLNRNVSIPNYNWILVTFPSAALAVQCFPSFLCLFGKKAW